MRSVPIQVYKNDVPEREGFWHFGVWGRSDERLITHGEEIWGLAIDNWPTQMCYGFEYANPWIGIKRRRQLAIDCTKEGFQYKASPEEYLRWYFDAGRRIYCTLDELERCLRALNIEENYEGT